MDAAATPIPLRIPALLGGMVTAPLAVLLLLPPQMHIRPSQASPLQTCERKIFLFLLIWSVASSVGMVLKSPKYVACPGPRFLSQKLLTTRREKECLLLSALPRPTKRLSFYCTTSWRARRKGGLAGKLNSKRNCKSNFLGRPPIVFQENMVVILLWIHSAPLPVVSLPSFPLRSFFTLSHLS